MYRHPKPYGKVINFKHGQYEKSRYKCEDCNITCTSSKQLDQHLKGIKHNNKKLNATADEAEESTFPLENMVVIDETDEDMPNEGSAASPASCDSSDSEAATSNLDFQTIENISKKYMVVLDETNDDNDHPASPASCDTSGSAAVVSSTATATTINEQPKKRARKETPDCDKTTPGSPFSVVSSCSSNSAPEAENVNMESEEPIRSKHSAKIGRTKQKSHQEAPRLKPVESNKEVFQFLKNFEVADKSDVEFALKIARMLAKALSKYKEEKLEEMVCTEAEHSTSEELCVSPQAACPGNPSISETLEVSNSEPMHPSISQVTTNSDYIRRSASKSPRNSSAKQCVSQPSSSTDYQPSSPIIKHSSSSSHYPDVASNSSRSPTNVNEVINSLNKTSATNSTTDDIDANSEADLLMETENCLPAEAACSDDDDDDDDV